MKKVIDLLPSICLTRSAEKKEAANHASGDMR
jgi:hypothetical protein